MMIIIIHHSSCLVSGSKRCSLQSAMGKGCLLERKRGHKGGYGCFWISASDFAHTIPEVSKKGVCMMIKQTISSGPRCTHTHHTQNHNGQETGQL